MTEEKVPHFPGEVEDSQSAKLSDKSTAPTCECGLPYRPNLPAGPCIRCDPQGFLAARKSLPTELKSTIIDTPQVSRVTLSHATPPVSGLSITTTPLVSVTPNTGTNTTEPYLDFWESREVLAHLRQFAHARIVAPWALLGAALVRTTVAVPHFVALPPLTGKHGNLNLFAALIGRSGAGKGASMGAAEEAINHDEVIHSVNIGSGEGIVRQYCRWDAKNKVVERVRDAVLFEAQEIDTMGALAARSGSTLVGHLNMAYSGEKLGFGYADAEKGMEVPKDRYRLSLIAQVQPKRAAVLFADADSGTPQRYLWLPATDPWSPDILPEEPLQWQWKRPNWDRGTDVRCVLAVCPTAVKTIQDNRRLNNRGLVSPLDGHSLYTRLKVAAALALLDRRIEVSEEDWQLATVIMEVSDKTRDGVQAELSLAQREKEETQAVRKGHLTALEEDQRDQAKVIKMSERVWKKFINTGGSVTVNELKQSYNSRYRDLAEDAISLLLNEGRLEVRTEIDHAGNTIGRLSAAKKGKK